MQGELEGAGVRFVGDPSRQHQPVAHQVHLLERGGGSNISPSRIGCIFWNVEAKQHQPVAHRMHLLERGGEATPACRSSNVSFGTWRRSSISLSLIRCIIWNVKAKQHQPVAHRMHLLEREGEAGTFQKFIRCVDRRAHSLHTPLHSLAPPRFHTSDELLAVYARPKDAADEEITTTPTNQNDPDTPTPSASFQQPRTCVPAQNI